MRTNRLLVFWFSVIGLGLSSFDAAAAECPYTVSHQPDLAYLTIPYAKMPDPDTLIIKDVENKVVCGGTMSYTLLTRPRTYNPITRIDPASYDIAVRLFASLLSGGEDSPAMAAASPEKRLIGDKGESWTFLLRRGLKFSNGDPVTVEDVRFTFENLIKPKEINTSYADLLACGDGTFPQISVDAPKRQITFVCSVTTRAFVAFVGAAEILNKKKVIKLVPNVERSPRDFNSALGSSSSLEDLEGIGAGPFVLSKIDPNSLAEFKRNRYFWQADASGNQLPYLEGIRVVIIPMTIASVAQETAIFQFRNGQTDWIIPRPDDIVSLQSDKIKGFPVNDDFDSGQASSGITFWAVNWAARNPALRAVFRNRDFRVALSHLTDRDTMKKIIFKGMATDNYSFLNPNSPFYFERPDQTKEMLDRGEKAKFKFDPERANLILDRIGLKDTNRDGVRDIPENFDGQGNPAGRLEFTMITNEESDVRKFMAQEIATDAKRASIVIKVEMRRTEILSDSLKVGDYEAVLTQLGGGFTPESSANVYLCEGNLHFFNVDCPKNRTNFERELDDFYKKGIITRNFTEAQKHWDEVQIFISQFQPIIPLPQQNALFAYRTDVLRNHGRAPHLTQSFIYCLRSSCIGDTQK